MIARDLTDFEGWVRSHSAALAAWCVAVLPNSDARRDLASLWLDDAFASNVETLIQTAEDFPEDDSNLAGGYSLWTLPEYPLRMLARLSISPGALPKSIERLPTFAAKFWEDRTRQRRRGAHILPSRARATNIISSNIIDGLGTSDSILRLAGRLLHSDWREAAASEGVQAAFRQALPTLRRMPGDAFQKLQALISVRTALKQLPNDKVEGDKHLGWSRVEYNIVNSLFIWPLLVARSRGPINTIGLSIPVFIGIRSEEKARAVLVKGSSDRLHANWLESIKAARQAAIDLWLKETGFFGALWRDQVRERTHVVFDVSAAEMLLDTVGKAEWDSDRFEFEMEGRSLEVPTALSIFSQLRGLRAPFAAGSTGMLAPVNHADQDDETIGPEASPIHTGFDRDILMPAGLVEKLEWADAAGVFDKLIFPGHEPSRAADQVDVDRHLREQQRLSSFLEENSSPHRPQINFCKRLSNAADAAFRGQWRRTQFVRCPEALELMRPENAERFGASCRRVMEILAHAASSVVIMPVEITFSEMCGAMAWLNLYGQHQYQAESGIPPMLAVAFVRLVLDGGGDRLSAELCDVARAPIESAQYVCSAGSEAEQGRRLADVLNKRQQDHRHPGWRAPDLIVCAIPREVLSELQTSTAGNRPAGPWRQSLSPLLTDEFSDRLHRIADERWGDAIGCVRLVFVADGDVEASIGRQPGGNKQKLDSGVPIENKRAELLLAPLSVFRSEFSQQEAVLLARELDIQDQSVRRALLSLQQCGYVTYTNGSWSLTKAGKTIGTSEAHLNLASGDLHAAAAIARAPYLSSHRLPGLSDFEARRTDRVHEAQFHIAKALADTSQDKKSLLQAWKARLALHFDVPGWGLIVQAARDRDLTKERPWAEGVIALGEQLLATALANREEIEPDRLASLFRAIEQRKRRIEGGYQTYAAAHQDDEWQHLTEVSLSLVEKYAGMARGKSDWGLPILDTEERELEQITGTISLVTILLAGRFRLTTSEKTALSTWLNAALPLVPPDELNIPPTWFEHQGDALKSNSDAREWYERGYLSVPGYVVNWIKALGCLAEDDDERMDKVFSDLSNLIGEHPDQWKKMSSFVKRNKRWELAKNTRWNTGIQYAAERGLLE